MDILEKITAVKKEEVKRRKTSNPAHILENSLSFSMRMPSFFEALIRPEPSVIGEFKRRSPSKGEINITADIREVAIGYQNAGIAAMSVLTDEEFFGGNNSDLQTVAGLINIPLLRKEFIVDEYQIIEAKSLGASAILLIAAILTKKEVDNLSKLAVSLGMDILFEVHDLTDLEKISPDIKIIGVNNRNLKTFEVSMDNSGELIDRLPGGSIKVAESGISSYKDVQHLYSLGYDAFLIGENFMRSENPGLAASIFINKLKS